MTAVNGKPETSFRKETRTIVRASLRSNCTEINGIATFVATSVADLQKRNCDEFDQMCLRLDASPTNVQPRVVQIFHEIFSDGITWGRIIAFLGFMKHFAADCEKRQLYGAVDSISEWSVDLISTNLELWIHQEGGWVKRLQQLCMYVVYILFLVGCH